MKKIEKIYAVLSDDGIFAIESEGNWFPVVFSEAVKLNEVLDHIQTFSKIADKELTLVEFTARNDIKVFKPYEKD